MSTCFDLIYKTSENLFSRSQDEISGGVADLSPEWRLRQSYSRWLSITPYTFNTFRSDEPCWTPNPIFVFWNKNGNVTAALSRVESWSSGSLSVSTPVWLSTLFRQYIFRHVFWHLILRVQYFFLWDPCATRILHRPSFLHSMNFHPKDPRFPHSALLHAIAQSYWFALLSLFLANLVILPF